MYFLLEGHYHQLKAARTTSRRLPLLLKNESGYYYEDENGQSKHRQLVVPTSFICIPGDGSQSEGTSFGELEHISSFTLFGNERVYILDTASHHILRIQTIQRTRYSIM